VTLLVKKHEPEGGAFRDHPAGGRRRKMPGEKDARRIRELFEQRYPCGERRGRVEDHTIFGYPAFVVLLIPAALFFDGGPTLRPISRKSFRCG